MISYAQNGEDVVLARLFGGRDTGRYVDVGAADPVLDSVTKHFYDLGWRGINIEPIPELVEELRAARPGDVTLGIALGAKVGDGQLHLVRNRPGWSTLDDDLAEEYRDTGELRVADVPVLVRTLSDVLDEYPGEVDFLKIDVEGAERAVLEGADWQRHRPRVVVVEATAPGSSTQTHQDWEPILLDTGYLCVLFDGLNRFYVTIEDTEAAQLLAAPANVLDGYERFEVTQWRTVLAEHQQHRAAEIGYIRRLEEVARQAQEERAKDAEQARTLDVDLREAHRQAARSRRYQAALQKRISELETAQGLAAAQIAELESAQARAAAYITELRDRLRPETDSLRD